MKIQSTGGFGNQLFQWSYAHHLMSQNLNQKFSVFRDSIHTAGRDTHLELLSKHCTHEVKFKTSEFTGRLLQLIDKTSIYSPRLASAMTQAGGVVTESNFGAFPKDVPSNSRIIRGYFQYPAEMISAITIVLEELKNMLISESSNLRKSTPYQLVHIRRGDFMNNTGSHGVLSRDYYRNSVHKELPVVFIGDEDEIPSDFKEDFNDYEYFGPNKLNEYETMNLALNCERFVMANSTFSWWCGLLAASEGSETLIPTPWTKNVNIESNLSLPQFVSNTSHFI